MSLVVARLFYWGKREKGLIFLKEQKYQFSHPSPSKNVVSLPLPLPFFSMGLRQMCKDLKLQGGVASEQGKLEDQR